LEIRKEHSFAVLAKARNIIQVNEKEKLRAAKLLTFGIKPFDALHLALAETGKTYYFCACDDRLLQNALNKIYWRIIGNLFEP
jgi:predicted nucleic acid-binding protein